MLNAPEVVYMLTPFTIYTIYNIHSLHFTSGPDYCQPNPCENSGRCRINGTTYNCSCTLGYGGRNCTGEARHPKTDPKIFVIIMPKERLARQSSFCYYINCTGVICNLHRINFIVSVTPKEGLVGLRLQILLV